MKNNNHKSSIYDSRKTITIALGSSPTESTQIIRTWEIISKIPANSWVKTIAFDAQDVEHHQIVPTVEKEHQSVGLLSNEVIKGDIGDTESRGIAEKKGQLWMAGKSFYVDTGVSGQNIGVGGDMRSGHAFFVLNKNKFDSQLEGQLRNRLNYLHQQMNMSNNTGVAEKPVIHINLINNASGGTGNGAFFEALHSISDLSAKLKIKVRITPILILMGTLNPGDRVAAARNQILTLQDLQTRFHGKYKDLQYSNGDFTMLCDPPLLISNANNYGEIPNFHRLKNILGLTLYLIEHSSFGAEFRQQAINLHDFATKDHNGGLRFAATIGLSGLSLDKNKIISYIKHQLSFLFTSGLLNKNISDRPLKNAAMTLSNLNLKETHTEDLAIQHLLSQKNAGGVNILDRAKSIFRERNSRAAGFSGCVNAYNAARFVLDNEIPKKMTPSIEKQCSSWTQDCNETIKNQRLRYLEKYTGLSDARQFLEELVKLIGQYEKLNKQKLSDAQRTNKALRNTVSHYEKIYLKLKSKNPITRLLSFSAKSEFKMYYPRFVEQLIQNELEISARKSLSDKIYPAERKKLSAELAHINSIKNNIVSSSEYFNQHADRLRNLSDEFTNPVGYEFADSEFMRMKLDEVINNEGGLDKITHKIFENYCGKFISIDAFSGNNINEINGFVGEFCKNVAYHYLWQLNILDVFKDTFPGKKEQYELISQLLGESDGRVKISGQADEEIPKVKFVLGPNEASVNHFVDIANDIDRRGGDWRGKIDENLNAVYFPQYRCQISLLQQIEDLKRICVLPDDPRELVKLGENPIVTPAPSPSCSDEILDRTIAQGLICGCIINNNGSYELKKPLDDPLQLGNSVSQIRQHLRKEHPNAVYIYSEFVSALATDEKHTLEKITNCINSINTEPLVSALGTEPFIETKQLAEALLVYVRRMPFKGKAKG